MNLRASEVNLASPSFFEKLKVVPIFALKRGIWPDSNADLSVASYKLNSYALFDNRLFYRSSRIVYFSRDCLKLILSILRSVVDVPNEPEVDLAPLRLLLAESNLNLVEVEGSPSKGLNF